MVEPVPKPSFVRDNKVLEEDSPKQNFLRLLVSLIYEVAYQIQANSVRGPVGIGLRVPSNNWILGPRRRIALQLSEKQLVPLRSESLISVEYFGLLGKR